MKLTKPKLTRSQQNALHKYFELLAEALNSAGLDMKKVLKPGVAIPWSPISVKEFLWRPIQKACLGKYSTTELNKFEDINIVFDTLNRHLSEKFYISEPFPSLEQLEIQLEEERRIKCLKNQQ